MFLQGTTQDKVKQILSNTGLDFTIDKQQMQLPNGTPTPYYALINSASGNIINSVKEGYTVSQNDEVVELVLKGIEKFGSQLSIQKGGSLNDGRRVYLQLAIEGDGIVGNDTVKRYITVIDSNDGSTGLSVGIGDFTMSCSNQFFQFHKQGQSRFRHTVSIEQRIKEIPQLIEMSLSKSLRMIELYNKFQSTACSRNLANQMVNAVLGFDKATMTHKEYADLSTRNDNMMNSLYNNIELEMNSKGNNVWGLHSGVTRWTTHDKSAPKRDNGRLESILVGNNYKTNQKSLAFASSLI